MAYVHTPAEDVVDNAIPVEQPESKRDESEIVAQVDRWFTESKDWMETRRNRWRRNETLYMNESLVPGPSKAMKLKFAIPFSVVETELSIISDYMPMFDVMPQNSNDIQFADIMQNRVKQVCKKGKFRESMLDDSKDNLIYSNGIIGIFPKYEKVKGVEMGKTTEAYAHELEFKVIDPFTWFPCPGSRGMDIKEESRYQIFATPMNVDEIARLYGKRVTPEGDLDEYKNFKFVDYEKLTQSDQTKVKMALVKECYYYDLDEETYPNGRLTIIASKQLLEDEAIQFSRIPYFLMKNYGNAHSLFGIGEPEMLRTLKRALDQVMSSIGENINKTGNPARKVKKSWLKDITKRIMGIPGEDIVVNQMDDVTWELPPGLPASTFSYIELLLKLIDVISGVQDVTQGRQPTGITAASAIRALQEAAQTRVRYKISKDITPVIVEIGRYIIELLQKLDEEIITIRTMDSSNQYQFVEYNPDETRDTKFDIDVVAGTDLPSGRVATEERAIQLFQLGVYSIERLLQALNEPNRQELIDEYNEKQQQNVAVQRIEQLNQIMPEFQKLSQEAMSGNGEWTGSSQEEQMAGMMKQFPELLGTDEFDSLPVEHKQRLITIFLGKPQGEAEQ